MDELKAAASDGDVTSRHDPSPDAVRAQLARVLRSPCLANAPGLSRLLAHVVERTLEGRGSDLKEYSLGVDVFERGDAFDPKVDTIVRVSARRLRGKLREYYESEGRSDPIAIELLAGRYAPAFAWRSTDIARDPAPRLVSDIDAWRHRRDLPLDRAAGEPVGPLPFARTRLIGREREVTAVLTLLTGDRTRLITLTGPGGSGKTRLALEVASRAGDEFTGGIQFAALASISDRSTAASTIGQMLGLRATGGRPLEDALQDHVRRSIQTPTLLVLDNFEQLLAAAPLVAALLEANRHLNILVTSRAALRLRGEYEFAVAPLPVPGAAEAADVARLAANPAVALFVERASAILSSFSLTTGNAAAVAHVCTRLDGLPLAIELAAPRIAVLSIDALLARLDDPLGLLTGGVDFPPRQQTLRDTIAWSHRLLSPPEQQLFRRLSVFAGGCTLEGVEAVCNTRRDLEIDALTGVASLVGKSLLRTSDTPGERRFDMLQTIREYALAELEASGDADATRRSHAAYCLVLAEEGNPRLTEPQRAEWLARCDAEHDNLRAALAYLIERRQIDWALRLGVALYPFWERREHLAEGRERLETLAGLEGAMAVDPERWLLAATYAGNLATTQSDFRAAERHHQRVLEACQLPRDARLSVWSLISIGANKRMSGDADGARQWLERSVAASRELGDATALVAALSHLGTELADARRYADAARLLEEALSVFRTLGDPIGEAWSLNHLGDVARESGDPARAEELYRHGARIFEASEDSWGLARSFADLGLLASARGDAVSARPLLAQALTLFQRLRHNRGVANVLELFADLAIREHDVTRALTLAAAADALRSRIGASARPIGHARVTRTLEIARERCDPGVADVIWNEARRMPLDRVIGLAIGGGMDAAES